MVSAALRLSPDFSPATFPSNANRALPSILVFSSRAPNADGQGAGGAMGATLIWLRKLEKRRKRLEKTINQYEKGIRKRKLSPKRIEHLRQQLKFINQNITDINRIQWMGVTKTDITGSFNQAANTNSYGLADSPEIQITNFILNKDQYYLYYVGIANQFLWPASHLCDFAVVDISDDDIEHIKTVTSQIAGSFKKTIRPGDVIHINDYQNMFLGEELRSQDIDNNIVYFHHIPVPSVQDTIAKCGKVVAQKMAIFYASLIHCNTANFQTPKDAENFIDFLKLAHPRAAIPPQTFEFYETVTININGRELRVGATPIGVDPEQIIEERDNPEPLSEKAQKLVEKFTAKNIFFSLERLDYTKGILDRVIACKQLLEQNPQYIGQVQFVMGAEPSRTDIPAYQEYKKQVIELINEINETYGRDGYTPIILNNEHIDHAEAMRIMASTKIDENGHVIQRIINLATPSMDGFNLAISEAALAQKPGSAGVTIVSSGAGAAQVLANEDDPKQPGAIIPGAIIYDSSQLEHNKNGVLLNPDILVSAYIRAIEMPQSQAEVMAEKGKTLIKNHNLGRWTKAQESELLAKNRHLRHNHRHTGRNPAVRLTR